jgi:hypothetical protein
MPEPPGPRPSIDEAARFTEDLLRALVREHGDGLELAAAVPSSWLGQGWEVHGAPTPVGQVSYAVRWHGARPALLWHVEPHDRIEHPIRLTAPGLDPAWSSIELRGEALLAPPVRDETGGSFS